MIPTDSGMLKIGNQCQTFFDNVLLETVQDITREYYSPKKEESNPLLVKDKPWEHIILCRTNSYRVLYDKNDMLFKCWYSDENLNPSLLQTAKHVDGEKCHPMLSQDFVSYRVLYAQSSDGINWEKPNLGKVFVNGENTNTVLGSPEFGSVYACHVIDDPFENDSSKRFKTLLVRIVGKDIYRIEAAYSSDGLNWYMYDELPSFGKHGPHLEDVIVVNYDIDSRQYILTTRHDEMTKAPIRSDCYTTDSFFPPYFPQDLSRENRRRIYQCFSGDFIHWSEPHLILKPDEYDNIDDTLYGMVRYRIGDVWVGVVMVLHQVADTMEAQLTYSRDGNHWNRIHRPWLYPGPKGEWDQIMTEMVNDPIEVGDELWFFYGASGWGHHDWYSRGFVEGLDVQEPENIDKVGFFLGLAKLRKEGFCSLSSGDVRKGVITTRPMISMGNTLVINARCRNGGSICIEITDHNDKVLDGFGFNDFDMFTEDNVRHVCSWNGKKDLPMLRYRKLRIILQKAEIFSFFIK